VAGNPVTRNTPSDIRVRPEEGKEMNDFHFNKPSWVTSYRVTEINHLTNMAEVIGHGEEFLEQWLGNNPGQSCRLAAAEFLSLTDSGIDPNQEADWGGEKSPVEEWGDFPHIAELRKFMAAAHAAACLPDPEWGGYKQALRSACQKILGER